MEIDIVEYIVKKELAKTEVQAKILIRSGRVNVNQRTITNPKAKLEYGDFLDVAGKGIVVQ